MSPLRVGIDIGGTFTDFAARDEASGRLHLHKALTTPEEPARGVLDGLDELLAGIGAGYADIDMLTHATTLATNAVLERRSRPIGLITTSGFRDVLQIQRQKRHELYNLFEGKIPPLVARQDTYEVAERVDHRGNVLRRLEASNIEEAIQWTRDRGFQAVAVCLLHAYRNPSHEVAIRDAFERSAPDTLVSISSDVAPVIREYERANTVVVNAFVLSLMQTYLSQLQRQLEQRGFARRLYLLNSAGGLMTGQEAARQPVRVIESGPAAGALMAGRVGTQARVPNLVSFDMGGTSAKVCVVNDGAPNIAQRFEIERSHAHPGSGLPIAVPAVDLVEIGRGGGSIAKVRAGLLEVGPESASADPGPACYGRGGTRPTVTDANLLLGYLDPDSFLGGRLRLDTAAAETAVRTHVAEPLGLDVTEAAWGIHAVVNDRMAGAARLVTIQQGLDPRTLAFVAFGGAGPSHASRLAREIGSTPVIVPPGAGVASAIGLLHAEISFDFARTIIVELTAAEPEEGIAVLLEMATDARDRIQRTGVRGTVKFAASVDMRYKGQGHEINVPMGAAFRRPSFGKALLSTFTKRYHQIYGFSRPHHTVEAVTWRLRSWIAEKAHTATSTVEPMATQVDRVGKAYFPEAGGWTETRYVPRANLREGTKIPGPAVIQEPETATLILPGDEAMIDRTGALMVRHA